MTTWSLCQTEGPETSLTNYVDAPKHGIHPHNAVPSQSFNRKWRAIKTALSGHHPIDISCHVKDDKLYAIQRLSQDYMLSFCKNSVYNIEAGIHKLEFTAYIYLTVYSGILRRSLQNGPKVGTVLLWSWQIHVWSTLTLSFCPMTG